MKKTLILYFIAFSSANLAVAQLPTEYKRSIYEEVKHPFPLLDTSEVLSKNEYYFKQYGEEYHDIYGINNFNGDSMLTFSYSYDTLNNSIEVYDSRFGLMNNNSYYLSKNNQLKKFLYHESYISNRRLIKKIKQIDYFTKKTYNKDSNGVVLSSLDLGYKEVWTISRHLQKQKLLSKEDLSRTEVFYNKHGFPDSSISIQIKAVRGLKQSDTLTNVKRWFYNSDFSLDSLNELENWTIWQKEPASGLFWRIKERHKPFKKLCNNYEVSLKNYYNKNGQEIKRNWWQDSIQKCSNFYEYNRENLLERALITYQNKKFVNKTYTYDSLSRTQRSFENSGQADCIYNYPNQLIHFKKIVEEPWKMIKSYTYFQDNSYQIVTSHTHWGEDTTYFTSKKQLVRKCPGYGPCVNYRYNIAGKLTSVTTDNKQVLQSYKYNGFGLLTEEKWRDDADSEFQIRKTYYTYK